jgi:hypothetical protein
MTRLRFPVAFAIPLAYAAGLWLLLIYKVAGQRDGTEPRFALQWLRDSTLALPVVLVAVWVGLRIADGMLERRGNRSMSALAGSVTASAVALAAGAAMAIEIPIRHGLFGSHDAVALPLPLHMLRDGLLALFVTVPVSAAVVALTRARAAEKPLEETGARRTNRATFLKAGAGGLVTVAGSAGVLRAVSTTSASAALSTVKVPLLINEGYVKMTDGTPVWMRGFALSATAGSPLVPGPPIGPPLASVPIGEVSFVLSGQPVEVTIKNTLTQDHTFFIQDVVGPVTIPAGGQSVITFNTPDAPVDPGTYIYADADPVQRLLGLHGVMVVMPADGTRRPYVGRTDLLSPPTFDQQYSWVLHDVDPVVGEQARTGQPIDLGAFLPRYFTINGVSGEQSVASRRNLAARRVNADGVQGKGTLYRIVNTGAAFHSPHFHGNHVYVLQANNRIPLAAGAPALGTNGRPVAVEKDVFGIESLGTRNVLLPFHTPFDQWPPYDPANSPNYRYPMHCHAEMSQTAGGGQYPSGMYTEWELSGPLGPPKPIGG